MKITTLIMTVFLFQVSAATKAQITLNAKKASLQAVLETISTQSGYDFVYSDNDLKNTKPVNVKLENASIDKALQACFEGQPLIYEIADKTVMVKRKEDKTVIDRVKYFLTLIDVHGRVVDEKGESMLGVTVKVKDQNILTTTDRDGYFFLRDVNENQIITFSFIGYSTKELNVKSDLGIISLEINNSKLDEVQIIAYGQTSRRLSTSNTGTIKSSDIENQPISNPLLALQGRLSGVFIEQATGFSGSGIKVRIQGQNSISNGNDPLYIIDGVPYVSQLLPTLNNILGNSGNTNPEIQTGAGNPLSFINPSDIESIDVLKDADATSIYGSRAGNGAILITTKKGKSGKTKVDFNIQEGYSKVPNRMDLLNTQQYLQMREQAINNDGLTIGAGDVDINGVWDKNRNTDWQKYLIGGTAKYLDAQTSISGGNANNQFLIGGDYKRQTTVFPGELSDIKGSVHFNFNSVTTNEKLHFQLSGNYLVDNNGLINRDLTEDAIKLPPNAPALYNSDGTLNWAPDVNGNSTFFNPLAYLSSSYNNKTKNLISSSVISYKVIDGLEVKTNLGYTNLQSNESILNPFSSILPERRQGLGRSSEFGSSNINSWSIEPQINFNHSIGGGIFNALVGSTFLQQNNDALQILGYGFNSDLVLGDIKSASNVAILSNILSEYKYNALFTRLNYNYKDKFIINFSIRRDGSSRFGEKSQFHNFGSLAGAWIFSQEKFIQQTMPALSFGKLRASYGTTGNDQIGNYRYLNLYAPTDGFLPYQGVVGLSPKGVANPYLEWELTKKINLGMDLGFLNDRILVNFNYSRNQSSNQLVGYALPDIAGTGLITNTHASIENSSWEISINTVNFQNNSFRWSTNFNLTVPTNKLLSYPGLETSSLASTLVVGQPVTIAKAFDFAGVNPQTGVYQFYKKDGSITDNPDYFLDRTKLYNTSPTIYGGLQNTFSYGGVQLDFLFQFVKQIGYYNPFGASIPGAFYGSSNLGNQPTTVLGRWQNIGDRTTIERYSSNYDLLLPYIYATQSSATYTDASYIRLKNLSLSWQIPDLWTKQLNLQKARLFIQGQNLMTITNYKGLDPETKSSTTLPVLRTIVLGFQLTL